VTACKVKKSNQTSWWTVSLKYETFMYFSVLVFESRISGVSLLGRGNRFWNGNSADFEDKRGIP